MKKYIFPAIVSAFLIVNSAAADEKPNNNVRGILGQTGIGLKENTADTPSQETTPVADPVKWQDNTRFSKQPQKPAADKTPAATTAEKKCYYVTSQVTNIRNNPSFLSERTGIYKKGSYICEENRIGDWIDTGKGWVNTKFLSVKMPEDIAKPEVKPAAAEEETKTRMTEYNYDNPVASQKTTKQPKSSAKTIETVKPAKQEAKTIYKYITGGKVNIRSLANLNADIVGQYQKNEKIEVLETRNGWIRTNQGWVNMEYVSDRLNDEKTVQKEKPKDKIIKCMYVSYKKANIRKTASKSSKLLGDYDTGEKVCLYEINDDWGRSEKGWVNLANLKDVKCFTVGSKTLKARKKPDSNAKVLKTYSRGDTVCEYDRKYGWVDTGKGWVAAEYLER